MTQTDLVPEVRRIIGLIRDGVQEEDNNIRPFDLLDYYLETTLPYNEFVFLGKRHLRYADYEILDKFVLKNTSTYVLNKKQIDSIYKTKNEVECQKDKNGFPIPGTGRIITMEEKDYIFSFLSDNNIPLTSKTYNLAYNRYLKGKLPLCNDLKVLIKKPR